MKKFITILLLSILSLLWGVLLFKEILFIVPILLILVVLPIFIGIKKGLWNGLLSLALLLLAGTFVALFSAYCVAMMMTNAMNPYYTTEHMVK
jgi:hypothetical protein